MKFLAALLPMLLSVAGRIFTALGLTAITYVGLDVLVGRFKNEIFNSVSGAPQAVLQFFYLSGGGVVLNIFFGALTFILTFKSMTKLGTSLGKGK